MMTKAVCPPSTASVVSPLSRRRYPECDAWREYALRRLRATADHVVVAGDPPRAPLDVLRTPPPRASPSPA